MVDKLFCLEGGLLTKVLDPNYFSFYVIKFHDIGLAMMKPFQPDVRECILALFGLSTFSSWQLCTKLILPTKLEFFSTRHSQHRFGSNEISSFITKACNTNFSFIPSWGSMLSVWKVMTVRMWLLERVLINFFLVFFLVVFIHLDFFTFLSIGLYLTMIWFDCSQRFFDNWIISLTTKKTTLHPSNRPLSPPEE